MQPRALAYLGVRTADLADWRHYGTTMVGLQLIDRAHSSIAFRMDDRKQRIIVEEDGGAGVKFFGWEVADADELTAFGDRLERNRIPFVRGSRALAEERQVADLLLLDDPLGNRLELCWGCRTTTDPFVPGRNNSGFRTGALGMGHVVLSVQSIDASAIFYRDILGFRVSDYYSHPFPAMFFHVNPRHHSFALVQSGKDAVHHMMLEHWHLDDVGQGYDIAQIEDGRLAVTLGRHAGDYMTSYYTRTPSGFMVEHGWGGRIIDPNTWEAAERKEGPSIWGHERSWAPPEVSRKARDQRLRNAAEGLRRPVQVVDGNYNVMPGVCAWWDTLKGAAPGAALDAIDME